MASCAGPIGAASPPARYILSGICRASGRVCFRSCGLLLFPSWRGVCCFAAVLGFLGICCGVAALLLGVLVRFLLQFLQGRRFLRCCCFCSGCQRARPAGCRSFCRRRGGGRRFECRMLKNIKYVFTNSTSIPAGGAILPGRFLNLLMRDI